MMKRRVPSSASLELALLGFCVLFGALSLGAGCQASIKVGDPPTPTPQTVVRTTERLESDLPSGARDYVVKTMETVFRDADFAGLGGLVAPEVAAIGGFDRLVLSTATLTGPLTGQGRVHEVIAWDGVTPYEGPLLFGEYIIAAEWEQGDGFLRLRVAEVDGELVIFGWFVGLFAEGQTIDDYVQFVRAQLGLPPVAQRSRTATMIGTGQMY
jgi:hypothetical protein